MATLSFIFFFTASYLGYITGSKKQKGTIYFLKKPIHKTVLKTIALLCLGLGTACSVLYFGYIAGALFALFALGVLLSLLIILKPLLKTWYLHAVGLLVLICFFDTIF